MIRALIENRKCQTRRLAWRHVPDPADSALTVQVATPWQRVQPGDRLWVREAWNEGESARYGRIARYRATIGDEFGMKWRSPIHMPRWASRLTIAVTAARVERIQAITEQDALAEGVARHGDRDYRAGEALGTDAVACFRALWWSLHGIGSWGGNPEVCVMSFSCARRNIDSQEAA